jgi:hypothetical protein
MKDIQDYLKTKYVFPGKENLRYLPIGRAGLAQLLAECECNVGAEIGVALGDFSATLCKANPNLDLYCVDAWKVYPGYKDYTNQSRLDSFYELTKTKLEPYKCTIIRDWSMEAVKLFQDNTLDFVYIDSNHDFQHITNDLAEWSKKVKPGGVISGHDYMSGGWFNNDYHIKDVVDAWVGAYMISPLYIITHDYNNNVQDIADNYPSWLWVK